LALRPPIMCIGRAIWISVFVAYRGSGE
jgi:hypothetical protein